MIEPPGPNRRAPVQGEGAWWANEKGSHPPGTISWVEHLDAYSYYAQRYGTRQSAERIAERGGFSYGELVTLLGKSPETWVKLGQ